MGCQCIAVLCEKSKEILYSGKALSCLVQTRSRVAGHAGEKRLAFRAQPSLRHAWANQIMSPEARLVFSKMATRVKESPFAASGSSPGANQVSLPQPESEA